MSTTPANVAVEELDTALPPAWQRWIGENLLRGARPEELEQALTAQGIGEEAARSGVAALAGHPLLELARDSLAHRRKHEDVLAVYHALRETGPGAGAIESRRDVSRAEFHDRYYAANRPVVLADAGEAWNALEAWTPARLKERFGAQRVQVQRGRRSEPIYDSFLRTHGEEMAFGDYVDLVLAAGETNEFYMTAPDRLFSRETFGELLADLVPLPEVLEAPTAAKAGFWFGPAGTVTPLHRDRANVLHVQVRGRKRFTLVPSYDLDLVYNDVSFFSQVNVEAVDENRFPLFAGAARYEVVLEPGQALFIPVLWWHHVRSVEVTISLSFTNFVFPNSFPAPARSDEGQSA